MVPNTEKRVDPTVEAIAEMFPEEFLRNTARATGVVKKERKIDPVILFWVLTLGFGVPFLGTIRGLKRKYEEKAEIKLSISSFYDRFTPEMVVFLQRCVLHAIEFQAQQSSRLLSDKLNRFKDLVIQDSTIIRLHASLAKIWPAARSKKPAAGVKVSFLVSAVVDSLNPSEYTRKGRQRLKYSSWAPGSRTMSCSSTSAISSISSSIELTVMAAISSAG